MRTRRTLVALALLPALALAQGKPDAQPSAAATGRYLYAAVPARADLVVHTPDLPALLATTEEAGLGSAKSWRGAFRAQMEAWGARTGAPEMLVAGAERLLAAADGEALLAALPMPAIEGPTRATILAFRTTQPAEAIKKALGHVFEGGLIAEYPGTPSDQQIGGRPVIAFADAHRSIYVLVQDGLVAASDHPLALGLLFRGLERSPEPEPGGAMLLEVRHGVGPDAWTGWTFGQRESLTWRSSAAGPLTAPLPAGADPVVAIALSSATDAPVLPVEAPDWLAGLPPGGPVSRLVAYRSRGGFLVAGASREGLAGPLPGTGDGLQSLEVGDAWLIADDLPRDTLPRDTLPRDTLPRDTGGIDPGELDAAVMVASPPTSISGGAMRLGWLRGWANGRVPLPISGVDRALLLGPLSSATSSSEGREAFVVWKTTDSAGELRGPRWHGPTTMLLLRTVRDIAMKNAPLGASARAAAEEPTRRNGADLPPPVAPRAGGDDAR